MHTIDGIIAGQDLYSVSPGTTVLEAARYMAERRVGAVAVLEADTLVGIISERDLMTKVVAEGRDTKTTLVSDVMSRRLVHGSPGDTNAACIAKMLENNCRHLPVLADGGRVVGMLSIRDLYRVDATDKAHEIEAMTEYMYSSPKVARDAI
jgi:CBS domain-containing protein